MDVSLSMTSRLILANHPKAMPLDQFLTGGPRRSVIWGPPEAPLWVQGESLMLFGPPSAGKSTLAQRLALARTGAVGPVLGKPVEDDGGRVLYLAMDRPAQIARSMARMYSANGSEPRITVWAGPLPRSPVTDTGWLADEAEAGEYTTIVIDSIKDVLPSTSDETSAGAYNTARQECLARGIEWLEIHHNRKGNADNKRPRGMDDLYGNRWLSAGAGSIVVLWTDNPGSTEIDLTQLKPIGDRHPDLALDLDKEDGELIARWADPGVRTVLLESPEPLTAVQVAGQIYDEHPTQRQLQGVRVQLSKGTASGVYSRLEGLTPATYQLAGRPTPTHQQDPIPTPTGFTGRLARLRDNR